MANKSGKFAIGAVFAAAAGYVTGILTAPKSGKETRKDIHDTAV
ncbi:MAG: YtxH domain-containing protein, partial [Actinobacteria bacterium]|nr:YtxH domain-containing protein [Actinomycetota bacterium]